MKLFSPKGFLTLVSIHMRFPMNTGPNHEVMKEIMRFCLCHSIVINFWSFMYLKLKKYLNSRSSQQKCSMEKVLKNLAIFTGKHLRWNLFLTELQARKPATVLKETPRKVFFCEYCENFKSTYFEENLQATASSC